MNTYETDVKAQDALIKKIKSEILELKKELKEAEARRNEIARHRIKAGDLVKLLVNVNDSYGETYLSKGSKVKITQIFPNQVGYEYGVPYGFCVGRDDFEKVKSRKVKISKGNMNIDELLRQIDRGETSPELEKARENANEAVWDATTGQMFPKLKGKYKEKRGLRKN